MNVDLTTIIVALISAVLGTGTYGFIIAFRKDRRDSNKDAASMIKSLQTDLYEMQEKQSETFAKVLAVTEEAAAAREEAAAVRAELQLFRLTVSQLVNPIIDWLDSGAVPPAPPVNPQLRFILRRAGQLSDHDEDDDLTSTRA